MLKRFAGIVLSIIMLGISCTGITGCGRKAEGKEYSVYFLNESKKQLAEKKIIIKDGLNIEEIIDTLLNAMDNSGKKNLLTIKPEYLEKPTYKLDGINVSLYFDSSYYDMTDSNEVLYRAAIVKELTQIDGIQFVRFFVGNKELVDSSGVAIGFMSDNDFVDDSQGNISDVEWVIVDLYYSNRAGDALKKNKVNLCYNKNVSLEKLIVEKIISGPVDSGSYATLPSDIALLSVSVADGICYVNFSKEFSREMVNTKPDISIYSIVNSLCGLDYINGVKIMVDGNSNTNYREIIKLDKVYSFNSDLIEK